VKSYRGRKVVDGVSFRVAPGEVVGLLGPNAPGRPRASTRGGARPPRRRHGAGRRRGPDPAAHAPARPARGGLPAAGASIFRKLTVRQNFTAVLEALGKGRAERESRADVLLDEFPPPHGRGGLGSSSPAGAPPRRGGAQLLNDPRYILFDEPFAGSTPSPWPSWQRLIGSLRTRGIGVLLTDHAVREALGICDRAYILSSARSSRKGRPPTSPAVPAHGPCNLGEKFRLDDDPRPEVRP